MISTSLLFTIFRSYLWQSVIIDALTDECMVKTYSGVYKCIYAKGRYFEHLGLILMFFTFLRSEKIKWFLLRLSSDFLEISSKGPYVYITQLPIRLNCSVGRQDIRSDLVDRTELWTDIEDKTERLLSLEKFMQIRTKTEVWSKN